MPKEKATPLTVSRFEWIRRGDGTDVLYKDGQIVSDTDEIKEQARLRKA